MQLVHWRLRIKFAKNILSINTIEEYYSSHVGKKVVGQRKTREKPATISKNSCITVLIVFYKKSSV